MTTSAFRCARSTASWSVMGRGSGGGAAGACAEAAMGVETIARRAIAPNPLTCSTSGRPSLLQGSLQSVSVTLAIPSRLGYARVMAEMWRRLGNFARRPAATFGHPAATFLHDVSRRLTRCRLLEPGTRSGSVSVNQQRILIVEDDARIADLISKNLQAAGYECHQSPDGG